MKNQTISPKIFYDTYILSSKERLFTFLNAMFLVIFFAYFFYQSMWAVLILWPIGVFYWKKRKLLLAENRKNQLRNEFQECILLVCNSLKAGYSAENAFIQSIPDVSMMFSHRSDMVMELYMIRQGIRNHTNLEDLLEDFANRSNMEEITEFAEVFRITKRNGGNMPKVLTQTAFMIGEKIEIDRQIQTIISGKRFEQKIMNVIPFFILLYVSVTSPGFFDILYHNLTGIVIMTICLLLYLCAYLLAEKLIQIHV